MATLAKLIHMYPRATIVLAVGIPFTATTAAIEAIDGTPPDRGQPAIVVPTPTTTMPPTTPTPTPSPSSMPTVPLATPSPSAPPPSIIIIMPTLIPTPTLTSTPSPTPAPHNKAYGLKDGCLVQHKKWLLRVPCPQAHQTSEETP